MNLVTQKRLMKKLGQEQLPCESAVHEYTSYLSSHRGGARSSRCFSCVHRKPCHRSIKGYKEGFLAKLHEHLHAIGALDSDGKPSLYGKISRYFPQSGGLLFAKLVHDEVIKADHMLEATELIASLSMARFKEPQIPINYRFPYDTDEIEDLLQILYPIDLFPEYYDTTRFGLLTSNIREFNPKAGWIIREWVEGIPWDELTSTVTSKFFSIGDVTAIIYRVASFLQSVHQSGLPHIASEAQEIRRELLRDPVRILL